MQAARRRDRERLLQLEEEGTDLELELSELESKIEDELEKMRAKLGGRYAKYAKVTISPEKSQVKLATGVNHEDVDASKTTSTKKEKVATDDGKQNLPFSSCK